MESRYKVLGHPIHETLVPLPLGLLVSAALFDVIYFVGDVVPLGVVSFWNMVAGVALAVVVAVFGLLDMLAIPTRTRARQIAFLHGAGNGVVVVLFLASAIVRVDTTHHLPGIGSLLLELMGLGLGCVTAWLGGELVVRLGVGVYEDAQLDAPSTFRPAGAHLEERGSESIPATEEGRRAIADTLPMAFAPLSASVGRHAVRTRAEREAEMHCRDIMKTDVLCLREYDSVARAAGKMREGNVGFLPVCDEQGRVLGTLTDRDIALRVCAEDRLPSGVQSAEVMTREVVSCRPDDSLEKAEDLMQSHQKSRLVVTDDDGLLVGVISLSDVARWGESEEVSRTMRAVSDREARP